MPQSDETLEITGLVTSLAAGASLRRGLVVRVESGPTAGSAAPLGAAPLSIGSSPECRLVLPDATVSARHAEVDNRRGGVFVRDVGSTNGTYVGGARVIEAQLPPDGAFTVGKTTLRLIDGGAPRLEPSPRVRFGQLVGKSVVMREVFAALELAAPTVATVLLEGPSGSGKEVAARALHDHSQRAGGPFVPFDCGSVQPDLLTSSLMGHRKGAFTGATSDRPGVFVEAEGGTLFLDEVGELPLPSQTHLLRSIESRTVTPVGADRPRPIDVRLVAATHRDLAAMVDAGSFRLDLFHRLAVVHVRLPPLRQHLDDLPALIGSFYEGRGVDAGPIEGPNLDRLRAHSFEGNVRELRNILERSWVLGGHKGSRFAELQLWLGAAAAPLAERDGVDPTQPFKVGKEAAIERFEAAYLPALMASAAGKMKTAAATAELSRRHLRALLVKHGLAGPQDDDED